MLAVSLDKGKKPVFTVFSSCSEFSVKKKELGKGSKQRERDRDRERGIHNVNTERQLNRLHKCGHKCFDVYL